MPSDPAIDLANLVSNKLGFITPDSGHLTPEFVEEYNEILGRFRATKEEVQEIAFDELSPRDRTKKLYPRALDDNKRMEIMDGEIRLSRKVMATIIKWVVEASPDIPPAIDAAVRLYHRQMKPIEKALRHES